MTMEICQLFVVQLDTIGVAEVLLSPTGYSLPHTTFLLQDLARKKHLNHP